MQKFPIIMRDLDLSRRNFFDFESPDSAFRDKSVSDDINEIFFFFFKCHSRFLPYGFYGTFSVGGISFFQFHFADPLLPSGGATGLRGTFPGHPRPFHLTFTDIHNTYTPMGAFSRRDSNPC
jgi:hypothetical protein